jgi:hypothetical protein
MFVEGVIGYEHAACVTAVSTQTTAPLPSVTAGMPG